MSEFVVAAHFAYLFINDDRPITDCVRWRSQSGKQKQLGNETGAIFYFQTEIGKAVIGFHCYSSSSRCKYQVFFFLKQSKSRSECELTRPAFVRASNNDDIRCPGTGPPTRLPD